MDRLEQASSQDHHGDSIAALAALPIKNAQVQSNLFLLHPTDTVLPWLDWYISFSSPSIYLSRQSNEQTNK